MAETRLPSDATEQPAPLTSLWPFPGTILLVVFGAWLVYMGSIAELDDVATAFYGLAGVTAVLVLFSLRAISVGRVQRGAAQVQPGRRRRRHASRGNVGGEDVQPPQRRSAIVDEGTAPVEGTIYPGASLDPGMPVNARMQAREDEMRAAVDDDGAEPVESRAQGPEPTDAVYEPSDPEADGVGERPPLVAEPLTPRDDDEVRFAQIRKTIRQLEASINRERAERGAQIAKLEGLLKTEVEQLRAGAQSRPAGLFGDVDAAALPDLAAALDAIEARIATLEMQPSGIGPRPEGDQFLTITQFNNAVNSQLLPHVAQLVDKRVAAALDPASLRQLIGFAAEGGEDVADGSLGDRIASAHAAITAATEAAQTEREALRAEMARLERTARRALADAMRVRSMVGDAAEGDLTLVEQIAALRAAGGSESGASDMPAGVEERLAATVREVEELRGNLGAVTQHVARMGEHYQDLLARLDRIGEQVSPEAGPASGGGVQGEVDALRDALTTIIEQNREIRAQQEMLSARFEGPRNAG